MMVDGGTSTISSRPFRSWYTASGVFNTQLNCNYFVLIPCKINGNIHKKKNTYKIKWAKKIYHVYLIFQCFNSFLHPKKIFRYFYTFSLNVNLRFVKIYTNSYLILNMWIYIVTPLTNLHSHLSYKIHNYKKVNLRY